MKTKIEDVAHLLMAEKEDNYHLKNRLQDFQGQFRDYKDITIKKTNQLESLLSKAKKRERDCKIFHIRKGSSVSAIGQRTTGREENYSKEKNDNLEFDENKSKMNDEIKKMSKTMTLLKKDKSNKENEIKSLKNEKKNLNMKIQSLENDINKLIQQNNSLNKQIQDINNKKKITEKDIKQQAIDAKDIIKKLENENEELKNKNKDLQNNINCHFFL